jgi:hypothetical protein
MSVTRSRKPSLTSARGRLPANSCCERDRREQEEVSDPMTLTSINPHQPSEVLGESEETGSQGVVIILANISFRAENRTKEGRNSATGNQSRA